MKASICRRGFLPKTLIHRKTPSRDQFPGLAMNRRDRMIARHVAKNRGRWSPETGWVTWSKHNMPKCRQEMERRFMETGRL